MEKERTILEQVARLITPRKLMALILTTVAAYLWVQGTVDLKEAFLMVVAFYFGKSTALDKPGEEGGG